METKLEKIIQGLKEGEYTWLPSPIKVKIVNCPRHPKYVGVVCKVVMYQITYFHHYLFKLADYHTNAVLQDWALLEDFEIVE